MNDDWLKENYEKALLVVGALAAVGVAGWLIYSSQSFSQEFDYSSPRKSADLPATGIETLQRASKAFNESATWEGENLFVSVPVLETWSGSEWELKQVGSDKVHDPIPDEWVNKWDLDITNPNLKNEDPDGDNFTNLEEWLNGKSVGESSTATNPTDPNSHPAFITKVCLSSMVESDLNLIFRGQVDPTTFQIDQKSDGKFPNRNELPSIGKTFGPDDRFRLDGFEEKRGVDANGVPVDESVAIISYVEAGGNARVKVPLTRNIEWEMPTHEGVFTDQFDGSEFSVQRGSTFKLANDPDNTFRVIEVNDQMAILKDQNGKDYQILPCQ